MSSQRIFLPKSLFKAHELFLRAFHLDQQFDLDKALKMYLQSGKLFTALTKKFPDMEYFYLWGEQARLAINRVKQLDSNSSLSKTVKTVKSSSSSKIEVEEAELRQRILRSRYVPSTKLSWDDVIGLDLIIEELKDTVFLPLKFPELLRGNITAPRNILLFGPPGTGKSYLVRVLASLAGVDVFSVSAVHLFSKWFGESQKMIRALFETAWEHSPSIIFIDEFDGIFGGSSSGKGDSDSSSTVIQIQRELQQYMDGPHTPDFNQTVTIAATNFPQQLKEPQLRRFDRILYVPPPTIDEIFQLLNYFLRGIPHTLSYVHLRWLAHELRSYTPSEIRKICEAARLRPFKESLTTSSATVRPLSLGDFKSSLDLIIPMLRARGEPGVGTILFRDWNADHGRPAIFYPIQPWERPGYHSSDDPNPIHLEDG